jgi:hypothetical protein
MVTKQPVQALDLEQQPPTRKRPLIYIYDLPSR